MSSLTQKNVFKAKSTCREGLRELSMTHAGPSNTKHQGVGMRVERSKEGILLLTFIWEKIPSSDSPINTDFVCDKSFLHQEKPASS